MRATGVATIVLLSLSGCDVLVPATGEHDQPCFDDGSCLGGLFCDTTSGTCRSREEVCMNRECGPYMGSDCGTCPGATDYCTAGGRCEDLASLGIVWIAIPGGSFMMGSASGNADELPVHSVSVPAFELLETEVTVAQYRACVDAGACGPPDTVANCNWEVAGRDDHPVNCVDWSDAVDFCVFASGRLPSEAEWEYAARGGGQAIAYPWGDQAATCAYAVMNEGGAGCGQDRTWAVCSKPAGNTAQGLCDLAGNVWEWVRDWYHSDYNGAPADGSAWESPSGSDRVVRGGGFYDGAYDGGLRAANRHDDDPSYRADGIGFRCAR